MTKKHILVILIVLIIIAASSFILSTKIKTHTKTSNNNISGLNQRNISGLSNQIIDRVVFIAFENHGYNDVINNGPYFNSLAQKYGVVTTYRDLKHAGFCSNTNSLPNYMAITSGSTLWNDEDKCGTDAANWRTNDANNIFSLLSNKGLKYDSWAEDYNGECNNGCIKRHVPALFYSGENNLKDFSDWDNKYLKGNKIPPNFSFITPNGCDSAHDCDVSKADDWLKNTFDLPALLQKPWAIKTIFILWFDESESEPNGYLIFVCPSCQGKQYTGEANPYSLLTTIEWSLGLGSTGNNDDPSIYPPMTNLVS